METATADDQEVCISGGCDERVHRVVLQVLALVADDLRHSGRVDGLASVRDDVPEPDAEPRRGSAATSKASRGA